MAGKSRVDQEICVENFCGIILINTLATSSTQIFRNKKSDPGILAT